MWGIGSDPDLSTYWTFKGGTSIKKCYIETWRFSEDLDFSIIPGGPNNPKTIEPIIKRILDRVHSESNIDFFIKPPLFKHTDKYLYTGGRIYYRGPRNAPAAAIKLDLSGSEKIVCPTVLQAISHPYSDGLLQPARVRCYSFAEVFAEKLRAMGERSRPRDLYDIVLLFRLNSTQMEPKLIKEVLKNKCATKGIAIPVLEAVQNTAIRNKLVSEWKNMLGHQLQALPPFEDFWQELSNIFNWLNEAYKPPFLTNIPVEKEQKTVWSPPPTIWKWGLGIPLESVRFAAVNHLCVELKYKGNSNSNFVVEPYSLRKTPDGNLVLYGIDTSTEEVKSYLINNIQSIKVTTKTFKARYKIEFSSVVATTR